MENTEKTPMKFAEGMTFKARHEKAPETVRGAIYFKVAEFTRFLEANKDERGWVHVKMMKSKEKGTIYFILDTWRPQKELSEQDKINVESAQRAGVTLSDEDLDELKNIPF